MQRKRILSRFAFSFRSIDPILVREALFPFLTPGGGVFVSSYIVLPMHPTLCPGTVASSALCYCIFMFSIPTRNTAPLIPAFTFPSLCFLPAQSRYNKAKSCKSPGRGA
ncbi:hypothetical protein BKA61DRAFT_341254 [Leptodontidium sp. MPI-SDFR-AT-0119]|nr:hypothetical protein BKA61DRAFT_341254 [Leptodontidium sp. MPI-SDFR-AT-0119]